jgi:hypothetical protein
MPTFDLTSPDGKTYSIEGPEGATPAQAFQILQQHLAASAPVEPVTTNEVVRSAASGIPVIGGLLNKANAATNAALAPALNPLFDKENQLQGDTFGERYAKSLALQEGADTKFAGQHPYVDTAAKFAGGAAAMAPLLAAAPGIMGVTGGLGARVAAGGASNAAIGGTDAAIRGENPVTGALIGGALGAGFPAAGALAHGVASPIFANVAARVNPERFGTAQVARAISESGMTPAQIEASVQQAAREGQGVFNVADAMGNAGQEMLGAAARGPGTARTAVVNALEGRQGTQGRRISNALAEGFNAPETAAQTEARMTAARGAAADADFGAVRGGSAPVDLVAPINHLDRIIGTQPGQVLTAANDSIEAALTPFRQRLARVNPDDFEAVQRIRGDMADAAEAARRGGQGNRARLIGGAVRQLDAAMEAASPGYRQANQNFAQASRNIEAVQTGRQAATRGRTEDTIPAFQALQPEGQQAFRSGYVDPLIANAQGAAFGANKARPLINDAFQAEANAMAPGNALMQRRIGREQTMFEGRATALGGSPTAKNLAHDAAAGANVHLIGQALTGNIHGMVRSLIAAGSNALTGNTPAVRQRIADILLQNGATMTPGQLRNMVQSTVARIAYVNNIARNVQRGASGGALAAIPDNREQRRARR